MRTNQLAQLVVKLTAQALAHNELINGFAGFNGFNNGPDAKNEVGVFLHT